METQLVKLDTPYNLICNKEAKFGLHIATLIVTNPYNDRYNYMSYISCYPVVERENEPGGEIWNDSELETCKVICRHRESITLHTIKEIMEYYYGWSYLPTDEFLLDLKKALVANGSEIILPKTSMVNNSEEAESIISDYYVELIFDNDTETEVCTIYSSNDSNFFFLGTIDNNPDSRAHPGDDEETTIIKMAQLRDAYLIAFNMEDLKKIDFFTKDKEYQGYVDKLNDYHVNEDIYLIKSLNSAAL